MEPLVLKEDVPKLNFFVRRKELAVVRLSVLGKTSEEISKELGCALKTVETHRHNVLKRTGCRNMPQLVGRMFKDKMLVWDGDTLI